MPLIDILQDIASDLGLDISNSNHKSLARLYVNNACMELFNKTDLIGSLSEQMFSVPINAQQISLPWYVGNLRGVRNHDTNSHLTMNDMRPRFFHGAWVQSPWTWRVKNYSPVALDIQNASQLTFTLPSASIEAFKVMIVGSTSLADQISETLTFNIGDTSKTTANQFTQFPGFVSISKDKPISLNLTVYDASSAAIAEIPNHRKASAYTIIHVMDQDLSPLAFGTSNNYEILYKKRLDLLVNDYDVFPCDGYDDAIKWLTLAHFYGKKTDDVSSGLSVGYYQQCINIINEREANYTDGVEKKIQFGPNMVDQSLRQVKNGWGNLYPYIR